MREIAGAAVELAVDAAAEIGEGPVWDDVAGELLWVDIPAGLVHRFRPGDGPSDPLAVGQPVGAVALREADGLVLAVRDGFALAEPAGAARVVRPVEADNPRNRMNDGKCDSAGRFWAGTMAFDLAPHAGALYRLDADLAVSRVLDGLTISNGIAWSHDDRTMYFIDSGAGGVDAYDFDAERGEIRNRRRLVDVAPDAGVPDGMTIDADGCLWVAIWDGWAVHRYTPDGAVDAVVRLPVAQVTSCAFGGASLDELYVTSARAGLDDAALAEQPLAGALFRVDAGARGVPVARFRG